MSANVIVADGFDAAAPLEPICRTPDLSGPCKWCAICHEAAQIRHDALGLRGEACHHFVRLSELATRYPSVNV